MEWGDFVNMMHDLAEQAKEEGVCITLNIYADHTEMSVEPFQPITTIEGSTIHYDREKE